jgi:hypothetical protein
MKVSGRTKNFAGGLVFLGHKQKRTGKRSDYERNVPEVKKNEYEKIRPGNLRSGFYDTVRLMSTASD